MKETICAIEVTAVVAYRYRIDLYGNLDHPGLSRFNLIIAYIV